jgi:hypothetical protein
MLRMAGAAFLVTALLAPGLCAAAPVTDWKQIKKVADGIETAAGVSLTKRMTACKMIVHPEASWTETRAVAWPDYGAKPGDTVLKLVFDVPPPPAQPGPGAKPNPPQKNVAAFWVISKGKAEPLSSWAKALQMRPVPLGYDASNNC